MFSYIKFAQAILGVYMNTQDYEERSRMGTQSFMIDDAASEYFPGEYNQSMLEQEDFVMDKLEHIFTQNLDKEFNWIIQKIKSVVDEAHSIIHYQAFCLTYRIRKANGHHSNIE